MTLVKIDIDNPPPCCPPLVANFFFYPTLTCCNYATLVATMLHLLPPCYTCCNYATLVATMLHLLQLCYTCCNYATLVATMLHLLTTMLHLLQLCYTCCNYATLVAGIPLEHCYATLVKIGTIQRRLACKDDTCPKKFFCHAPIASTMVYLLQLCLHSVASLWFIAYILAPRERVPFVKIGTIQKRKD